MNLPAAPLAERPAVDAPSGAAPVGLPSAPPDPLFAALLDLQTARTAPAEGQTPDLPDAAAPLPAPAAAPEQAPAPAPAPDATVMAQLAAALALPLPLPAPVAPSVPAAKADQPIAAKATVADAPVVHVAPEAPAAPAPVAASDDQSPVAPAKPEAEPVAERPAADGPQVPASAPKAAPTAPRQTRDAADPVPAAPAPQATSKPEPPKDAAPAARPVDPLPSAPAQDAVAPPAHEAAKAAAADPRPALRAERVEALVKLATRHGVAEARMELHPQDLGSVIVRLRVTSDGLSATFTASNPDAIPQLLQAGQDLRQSLESKGLTLATLDVRAQSDERSERRRGHEGGGRHRGRPAVEAAEEETLTSLPTHVPAGVLVDVQA